MKLNTSINALLMKDVFCMTRMVPTISELEQFPLDVVRVGIGN